MYIQSKSRARARIYIYAYRGSLVINRERVYMCTVYDLLRIFFFFFFRKGYTIKNFVERELKATAGALKHYIYTLRRRSGL